MPTLKQIVVNLFEAQRKKDLDAFMEFYTEDKVVKNFAGDVFAEGKAALHEFNRNVLETSPDVVLTFRNWVGSDNFVVGKETLIEAATPGFPEAVPVGVVYDFRDGLISGQIWLQ